jgi:translation initiation factor IF-2
LYIDGQAGWTTQEGVYNQSGCDGHYLSVPMSGEANQDDPTNRVWWIFDTGAAQSQTCRVWVYVPSDDNIQHVGGHPTYYTVYGSANPATGEQIGDFSINQVAHRGDWVAEGPFHIDHGQLSIRMHSRGIDNTSGYQQAHHAAAAISVMCSA